MRPEIVSDALAILQDPAFTDKVQGAKLIPKTVRAALMQRFEECGKPLRSLGDAKDRVFKQGRLLLHLSFADAPEDVAAATDPTALEMLKSELWSEHISHLLFVIIASTPVEKSAVDAILEGLRGKLTCRHTQETKQCESVVLRFPKVGLQTALVEVLGLSSFDVCFH